MEGVWGLWEMDWPPLLGSTSACWRHLGSLLLHYSKGDKGSSTVEAVAKRLSVAPGASVQRVTDLVLAQ